MTYPTKILIRCRDILISSVALILLSPVFLVVAILVKITSPGPVFYKTLVVGEGGRRFVWRKFRSMRVVTDEADMKERRERFHAYVNGDHKKNNDLAPAKIVDEQRITFVGRFIRKYSIDELPQLWNVFKGDMSLVGPRPCLPYEAIFFSGWRQKRFHVRPGLTGVWQIFGRGRVGFDEGVAMDVYYVYRHSLWFDSYLILRTLGVVLAGRGAR
ncbi:MAG: sugar transferase [bacterium]